MFSLNFEPGATGCHQSPDARTKTRAMTTQQPMKALPSAKIQKSENRDRFFSKTSLERLKQSHLVRDRVTDDQFTLDREALETLELPKGRWIPLEKHHPDEPEVDYFDSQADRAATLRLKATQIGPVSGKKPEYLEVPFDENGETRRLQVIC